jgi:hypothetical protein
MYINSIRVIDGETVVSTDKGTYFVKDGIATIAVKGSLKKYALTESAVKRIAEFK